MESTDQEKVDDAKLEQEEPQDPALDKQDEMFDEEEDEKYATLAQPHKFWDTQPMKKENEVVAEGPIKIGVVAEVSKEETALQKGFRWADLDLDDENQLKELYIFLNENYVEDKDAMFRFDYQPEFLKWAL